MRWTYYFAAVFFGGYLLLSNGVPLLPVLLGSAGAGLWMWWRKPSASR